MDGIASDLFDGFPPLPHLVQGLLCRKSGSVNATGVANYLAFVSFLAYCRVALNASFGLVTLIALTAPMVVIHTTVSYVDLFGNALLAIGTSSLLHLHLFPERRPRAITLWGHCGLIGAAWSKFNLVPVVAVVGCLFAAVVLRRAGRMGLGRRRAAVMLAIAATLAALPYLKNLAVHGNPLWPIRSPVFAERFPYKMDAQAQGVALLPQSHELRYSMFIPLTWAAAIGMLFPHFAKRAPYAACALGVIVMGRFGHMVSENRMHYRITRIAYLDVARAWGAEQMWSGLERGRTYCAVEMLPIGIMLTGLTMSESSIVGRSEESRCPDGSILLTADGVQDAVRRPGVGTRTGRQ